MDTILPGDLITPKSSTPIWGDPGVADHVGELRRREHAMVLKSKIDEDTGWTELQILHAGVVGWVLQDHVRKVR